MAGEGGQFFGERGPIPVAVDLIGVEGAMDGGHDDGDASFGGITFDAGATLPDGVVVAEAVEKIQRRILLAFFTSGGVHADETRGARLGNDDIHRRSDADDFAVIVDVEQGHEKTSLVGSEAL